MYKKVSAKFDSFNYPSLDVCLEPFVHSHAFSGIIGIYDFSSNFHQIYSSNSDQYSFDTCFRIASLSKPFLAMLILKNFDDINIKLSPERFGLNDIYWPTYWSDISIKELLSHCSGIPDCLHPNFSELYTFIKQFEDPQYLTNCPSDEMSFIKDNHGIYKYSNSNYFILTRLLEYHCQNTYDQILNDFLEFLDMKKSGLLVYGKNGFLDKIDGLTGGYWDEVNDVNRQLEVSFRHAGGSAGMFSTLEDMAKFSKEIYMLSNGIDCKLSSFGLTRSVVNDHLLTNQCDASLGDNQYGLGFRLFKFGAFGHGGMFGGFRAKFIMNKDGQCVIEMQNRVNAFPKVADSIYYQMFLNNKDCKFPSFKSNESFLDQSLLDFFAQPKQYFSNVNNHGVHSYKIYSKDSKLIATKFLAEDYSKNYSEFEIKLMDGENRKYFRDMRPEIYDLSDLDHLEVQIWDIDKWDSLSFFLEKESKVNDLINFITMCLFFYLLNQISNKNIL